MLSVLGKSFSPPTSLADSDLFTLVLSSLSNLVAVCLGIDPFLLEFPVFTKHWFSKCTVMILWILLVFSVTYPYSSLI